MEKNMSSSSEFPAVYEIDPPLFQICDLNTIKNPLPEEAFERKHCQRDLKLAPEDEISVDSIISALLAPIEASEVQFQQCNWNIDPKEDLNERQAIIFQEKLFISKLRNTNCKLDEDLKVFFDRELEQIGRFCLNVEESYDGYVVYSNSKMKKGKGLEECGHQLKGKYNDQFVLICEKRSEFDHVDNARVEKTLEVRNREDYHLIAFRETKINEELQKLKAVIDIKDRDHVFVLDGGIMLLMRHLIVNNFVGDFEYYSMNLWGRVIRCMLTVHKIRHKVRIFQRTYKHAIRIENQQCFNDELQEVSETYMTPEARIILHYWKGYNYLLHSACAPAKPEERIMPKLELMWRTDQALSRKYKELKKLNYENAVEYLANHTELTDFLNDYILNLLRYKPQNVLEFSIMFFQNMLTKR